MTGMVYRRILAPEPVARLSLVTRKALPVLLSNFRATVFAVKVGSTS